MPYDSEGNFTRIHNWEEDRQNDIDIVSDRHDEEDDNFANGLSQCMLRDGRSAMAGTLNMSNFQIRNVSNGTVATDAVNKGQLDGVNTTINSASSTLKALMNKLQKVGDIKASVRNTNHDNWFLCNGQAISRTTYSALFAIIGTNFGAGDGTTTFNLPDYRGKFLRGLGGNSAVNIYQTQGEGLPNITGLTTVANSSTQYLSGAFYATGRERLVGRSGNDNYENEVGFNAQRSNGIYGASVHVTPINQAVNYFIKVKEEA